VKKVGICQKQKNNQVKAVVKNWRVLATKFGISNADQERMATAFL